MIRGTAGLLHQGSMKEGLFQDSNSHSNIKSREVRSTPKEALKKQKAFNEKRMTSRRPNNIKLIGKTPQ